MTQMNDNLWAGKATVWASHRWLRRYRRRITTQVVENAAVDLATVYRSNRTVVVAATLSWLIDVRDECYRQRCLDEVMETLTRL